MTDVKRKTGSARLEETLDLTQTIRKLSMPAEADDAALDERSGSALLLCQDNSSRKWGRRWLQHEGLQVDVPEDPLVAFESIRRNRPDVIIVDASLQDAGGTPLYQLLVAASDIDSPVIALCSGTRESAAALESNVFDVGRKPFDWQLIGRRAGYAAKLHAVQARLAESNDSLLKALSVAEAAREQLRSRESFEPVTGLPNKSKFMDLLRRGMSAADRDKADLAVLVVGFTRFRLVIEAMGQDQADLILTEIGKSLADCLRDAAPLQQASAGLRTAAVAILDQFRFGIMLTCSTENDELVTLQQKLLETLSRPIQVAGQVVHLSACLGVAMYPHDADDVDSLLQRADNAMRDAQGRGGGFKYYCTETDAAAVRKLKIEHMLHESLDRHELTLAYQPITEIRRVRVISAEALLRWPQPDGSFIAPSEFVPVAEESGLIIRVGEYALDAACKQLQAWRRDGLAVPHLAVNVAKVQLLSPGFANTVGRILEKYSLQPSDIELELSERGVLSGDYDVIAQLHELRNLGVRLSIDDFGTGDSAIAYLKELPVDVLKIDRSYISGLTVNSKDEAIASAMVALGQKLQMRVIAEGVETPEQLDILRELGCDAFQGFLVSKPLAANDFAALLKGSARKKG